MRSPVLTVLIAVTSAASAWAQADSGSGRTNEPRPAAGRRTADAAPAPPARKESIEEIVERVKQELARKKAAPTPKAAAAPPPSPRVKLVWRPSVLWPAELTSQPALDPAPDRATVSWGQRD